MTLRLLRRLSVSPEIRCVLFTERSVVNLSTTLCPQTAQHRQVYWTPGNQSYSRLSSHFLLCDLNVNNSHVVHETRPTNVFNRTFCTSIPRRQPQYHASPYQHDKGFRAKVRQNLGLLALPKDRIRHSSLGLYEACTDKIKVDLFFKEFDIPDNFRGWFVVTELHVWMLSCRAMKEGPEGKHLRDQLLHKMWADTGERLKALDIGYSKRKESLVSLGEQFRAAIFLYDEGLLTDDKSLAAALWNHIYNRECQNPYHLERLVQYIRTQMDHLMSTEKELFLLYGQGFDWAHFEPFHVA